MNYIEPKEPLQPPIVINFGDIWPTSEPLSGVLGTTSCLSVLVASTADRGSDVGQTSQKLMMMGWWGWGLPCAL